MHNVHAFCSFVIPGFVRKPGTLGGSKHWEHPLEVYSVTHNSAKNVAKDFIFTQKI